ncbi:M4 family metallopeptidase [Croceiramulus getboli]|nr:M4 family metallopeptidase [Flavobacteriaceae bacterium YJPT1-3]
MKKNYKSIFFFSLMVLGALAAQAQDKPALKETEKINPQYNGLFKFDSQMQKSAASGAAVLRTHFNLAEGNDFQAIQADRDKQGFTHQKMQQYYKGVPVEFAKPTVHEKNGELLSVSGEFYAIDDLSVSPKISRTQAFSRAISNTGAQSYLWEDQGASKELGYEKPKGELVVLPVYDRDEVSMKLAYKFEIFTIKPLGGGDLYIDAQNGQALFFNNRVLHADNKGHDGRAFAKATPSKVMVKEAYEEFAAGTAATRYSGSQTIETTLSGGNYILSDPSRKVYTRNANNQAPGNSSLPYINNYTEFTDADNNWTAAEFNNAAKDNAALDAHWGAMNTYDYFLQKHGRSSYDGNGSQLRSYVHVDQNYDNAFWYFNVMSYGDGSSNGQEGNGFFDALTSIDVAAHEIGHGVTQFTSNLAYQRESGAMNEGFSDIWGAAVEHFAKGKGSDTNPDAAIWLIGDEIDRRTGSAALRSMSDPKSLGQPDTYGGTYWINPNCGTPTRTNDYCGVHTNSGVLNYWFYLTAVGGSGSNDVGDNYSVTGIGMEKAAQISYRMTTLYLSANSTFANARSAAINSAIELYGAGGPEEEAVTNAFYAVNVGEAYGGGNPGGPNYCTSQGNNVNDEYIGRVQIGSIDNTSGATGGYTDYTAISTTLEKGATATITITPTWTGTVYSEGYAVWIDYNQNGSFTDSGELVFSQAATTATSVSGNFTVPAAAVDGDTRMRVSMKYNGIPTSCETFTYGEVEDYTITIGASAPDTEAPTAPGSLTASNITQTTATLSWTASTDNVGVTGYDVYTAAGALLGTVTGTSANLTGLTASTSYSYYVVAQDAAGNTSAQSNTVTFTTEAENTADTEAPTAPGSLTASNITDTTVDLSWTASTDNVGVTGYDVYADGALLGTVTGTAANVTGLAPGTSYSYYVVAKDAAGNQSAASNTVNVTTTGGGGGGGPTSDQLIASYFETGWDGWLDGGSDCYRYAGTRSAEGTYSIRIRDNSGNASSMTTAAGYDLTGYDNVEITFSFYAYSMENGEDFWVRYNDGSGWQTVAAYARGSSFNNNTFYTATVNLSSANYNFTNNAKFRFQCDASANGDQIYIDEVVITASSGGAGFAPENSLVELGGFQSFAGDTAESATFEGDFLVFPNPARNFTDIRLALDLEEEATEVMVQVFDLQGRAVISKSYGERTDEQFAERLNVAQLAPGVYFIKVSAANGMQETHKLVKQ